MAGNMREK